MFTARRKHSHGLNTHDAVLCFVNNGLAMIKRSTEPGLIIGITGKLIVRLSCNNIMHTHG